MSIILDALRKSESERQQTTGPGLADTRLAPQGNRSGLWIPALALLLVANFVLLAAFWVGKNMGSDQSSAAAETELKQPEKAVEKITQPATRVPPVEKEMLADETPTARRELSESVAKSAPKPPQIKEPVVAAVPPKAKPAAARKSAESVYGALPEYEQMIIENRISGMPLHLDIHVFSETPKERFVFINTDKYREGEKLSEGPIVEEITPSGVIINHNGDRFILSRD